MRLTTFSAASERLLEAGVAASGDLKKIAGHLEGRLLGQPIVARCVATAVGVHHETVQSVLAGYADEGLLSRVDRVECPGCRMLENFTEVASSRNDGQSFECSECCEELALADDALPLFVTYQKS